MSMSSIQDGLARQEAINPRRSYIVQAPAGSGKTEILTQRYLCLLGTIQSPEQIIALTFTRKAANEMRERILTALKHAVDDEPVYSEHQQLTRQLAKAALARNHQFSWKILEQPSRLRIMTIDALCQKLMRAIPFSGQHIQYAELCDKPQKYYLQAAQNCFQFALDTEDYQSALEVLLSHLDNKPEKLIQLFHDLLASREQWLSLVYEAKQQDKTHFERAIAHIEQHELVRFQNSLPETLDKALIRIVHRLLDITKKTSLLRQVDSLRSFNVEMTDKLASILLTTQNQLRKAFDHHIGLKRDCCDQATYNEIKSSSQALFEELSLYPDFVESLCRVRTLPPPQYAPGQWAVLQALFQLLPLLVAHLSVVFSEHNLVDFQSIAEQARIALGNSDEPTDLALYLDHQIEHLLIDEFQDTSIHQFQLISQLVQGWEENDGRTLFVVGDPMQSIYRFRSAEVGLFLQAQKRGIGPVRLKSLMLTANFRSTASIVNWINQQFRSIFPQYADIETGAISFHSSTPIQASTPDSYIEAIHWENKLDEAEGLVAQVIKELNTYPNDSIAILVRSRHQLTTIIQTLRKHNIPFQGVDITLLANFPHIQDIYLLTEALLLPGHRLAWLSVLRSPWCGLSLEDIHKIANFNRYRSIYWALLNLHQIDDLSKSGRQRAEYVTSILHRALSQRYRQSLVNWLITTSEALHIKDRLTPQQQIELEQYWILLERFEQQGLISDLKLFKKELETLYSQQVTSARLQIMTIHKSKGLEFDCVMLPGLGSKTTQRHQPLFRWLKIPTQNGDTMLLLSPIKNAEDECCLLYDYLGKMDQEKEYYESQRLLYVAATRAKRRLYLFDHHTQSRANSFKDFLKHVPFQTETSFNTEMNHEASVTLPKRWYLPDDRYHPQHHIDTDNNLLNSKTSIGVSFAKIIGIATHDLLHWIASNHETNELNIPWHLTEQYLSRFGLIDVILKSIMSQIRQQIKLFLNTSIGQWIVNIHDDEHNEYELLVQEQGRMTTRILDRTFIDGQTRWIIDFKTGQDDEKSRQKYRQQLENYANIFSKSHPGEIRCGLYFLENSQWVSWLYHDTNIVSTSEEQPYLKIETETLHC